jgi:hypothetical protein
MRCSSGREDRDLGAAKRGRRSRSNAAVTSQSFGHGLVVRAETAVPAVLLMTMAWLLAACTANLSGRSSTSPRPVVTGAAALPPNARPPATGHILLSPASGAKLCDTR